MEEVKVKIIADTGKAQKNIEGVNDSLEQTGKGAKAASADVSEMSGKLDQMSGGAITKFKGLIGTIKGTVKGFVTLKGAIISSGIGLLVIGIAAVVQAFKSSEEGQNKFAKIMGVIGSVVGNVTDVLSDLGMKILENPLGVLEDAARNVLLRLKGILMFLPSLGKAISQVLSRDFKGAAKTASDAILLVTTGVENATEKISNYTKEIKKDAEQAASIANARARADKLERALLVDRAEADRKRAELLEKAVDRENFTTKQRIKFLEEAGKLEEKITNQEIEAAKIRLQTKIQENALSLSSKEDKDEQATLQAELIRLETARLTKQKEVTGQIIALRNEEKAAKDAVDSAEKAKEDKKIADKQLQTDAIERIQDQFVQKQKDKDAETELAKIELEEQRKLAELDRLDATEKQKLDVISFYAGQKADLLDKKAKEEEELDEKVKEAKINIAQQGLSLIQEVAGKGSSIGKAAAVAQATIAGIEGTINAFKTANASPITAAFPAYPYIQAGLAAAFSANNIKSIVSTKIPGGGGGGGGGAVAPVSAPPAFNVVGAAPENQLAETISGQDKKPVKAFVVSTEVSNEQALNRQIETEASIG